jgi:hypothetical protein
MSGPSAIGVVMALAAHVEDASGYIGMVIGVAAVALGFLILAIAVELA